MLIKFNNQTLINDIFNKVSLYGNGKFSSEANKVMINTPEMANLIKLIYILYQFHKWKIL